MRPSGARPFRGNGSKCLELRRMRGSGEGVGITTSTGAELSAQGDDKKHMDF